MTEFLLVQYRSKLWDHLHETFAETVFKHMETYYVLKMRKFTVVILCLLSKVKINNHMKSPLMFQDS